MTEMAALPPLPFSTLTDCSPKTFATLLLNSSSNFHLFKPLNQSFHHTNLSIPELRISCDDGNTIVGLGRGGGVRRDYDILKDELSRVGSWFRGIRGWQDRDAADLQLPFMVYGVGDTIIGLRGGGGGARLDYDDREDLQLPLMGKVDEELLQEFARFLCGMASSPKSSPDDSGFPGIRGWRDRQQLALMDIMDSACFFGGMASSPNVGVGELFDIYPKFGVGSMMSASSSSFPLINASMNQMAASSRPWFSMLANHFNSITDIRYLKYSLRSSKLFSLNPQVQSQPIHIQHTNHSFPIHISIATGGGDGNYGSGRQGGGGRGGGGGGRGDNNESKDKPGILWPLLSTWLVAAGLLLPSTLVLCFIMTVIVKHILEPKASGSSYSLPSILSLLYLLCKRFEGGTSRGRAVEMDDRSSDGGSGTCCASSTQSWPSLNGFTLLGVGLFLVSTRAHVFPCHLVKS